MKRTTKSKGKRDGGNDFRSVIGELISDEELERIASYRATARGRPAGVPFLQVLMTMLFDACQGQGPLSLHHKLLHGFKYSDAAISQRRKYAPWRIFNDLLDAVLKPRATTVLQKEAFYKGFRLIGLDGTRFSVKNTPAILSVCTKAISRRLSAAFAKINVCVLLEIGLHNPVAVAIARADESEWELSLKLVKKLPPESLLLADRLYGCTAFWQTIVDICQARQGHALVRVRKNVRRNIVQKRKLSDGSRVIEVPVFHPHIQHRVMHYLQLREIRATLARPGKKAIRLRFWTTLLDASVYPAPELVALYARRWGHEVYYRHLKRDLRRTELLKSNTVETACQEIAALLIASSLIAHQRTAAQEADPRLAVTDVSFNLVHQVVRAQWVFAAITADILSPSQLRKISRRAFDIMLPDAVPKKRSRSYPRAVRQPVKGWPRKTMNIVSTTPPVIRILTKWPIC